MKTYSIIGGIDGTGKSSFLGILKEVDPIVGVVVDLDQVGKCIDKGVSFTQETTLSGRTIGKHLPRWIVELQEYLRK